MDVDYKGLVKVEINEETMKMIEEVIVVSREVFPEDPMRPKDVIHIAMLKSKIRMIGNIRRRIIHP